jgi:hypothetical protein
VTQGSMTVTHRPNVMTCGHHGRVIVRILGGLGNQMFQYALGRAIAHRAGASLLLDTNVIEHAPQATPRCYDLDIFKLQPTFATRANVSRYHSHGAGLVGKVVHRLRGASGASEILHQYKFGFQPAVLDLRPPLYVTGYWQSFRYLTEIEEGLRRDFEFRDALPASVADHANAISRKGSVCLHVRRGDYLEPRYSNFIGPCDIDYYRRAVARVYQLVDRPEFFIFSDDLDWCRVNFDWLGSAARFMEYTAPAGFKVQASDLQLMTRAEYFIIANSTFSWWAAWLAGKRAKLVIAPKEWFKLPELTTDDLIPDDWERL